MTQGVHVKELWGHASECQLCFRGDCFFFAFREKHCSSTLHALLCFSNVLAVYGYCRRCVNFQKPFGVVILPSRRHHVFRRVHITHHT